MEILVILGFIALVAVIFGVSMHDAFWGIVAFFVFLIFAYIVKELMKYWGGKAVDKISDMSKPENVQKQKEKAKEKAQNGLVGLLLVFCIFYPVIMLALIGTTFKDFYESNPTLYYAIALVPPILIIVLLIIAAISGSKPKKRTRK